MMAVQVNGEKKENITKVKNFRSAQSGNTEQVPIWSYVSFAI